MYDDAMRKTDRVASHDTDMAVTASAMEYTCHMVGSLPRLPDVEMNMRKSITNTKRVNAHQGSQFLVIAAPLTSTDTYLPSVDRWPSFCKHSCV